MGFLDLFGLGQQRRQSYLDSVAPVVAPWNPPHGIAGTVYLEVFGGEGAPFTQEAAMRVPAVAKARHLLVSAISPAPLVALDKDGPLAEQPAWLSRTDTDVTPQERIVMTLDDLLFRGVSLWTVLRDDNDQIKQAAWCPPNRWNITNRNILIDEQNVPAANVILINAPGWDGLLNIASTTMEGSNALEKSWTSRAKNPIPLTVIRHKDSSVAADQLEQPEIDALLDDWSKARKADGSALGYLPPNLVIDTFGDTDAALYVEGRNAVRVDIANFAGMAASRLDGTVSESSLTYKTTEGEVNSFYQETVPLWADPITNRLSLDDVIPAGQRIRFDFGGEPTGENSPTGITTED